MRRREFRGTEAFNREARVLDNHLTTRPYLVGNNVTLADFSVAAPMPSSSSGH